MDQELATEKVLFSSVNVQRSPNKEITFSGRASVWRT